MITNYTEFSKIEALKTKFGKLFTYCRVERNNLLCSDTLTKSEKPNVRIDSKLRTKSLKLKIEENSITFISLNNSSGESGLITKVMNIISSVIEKNSTIFIDSDVSGGFWDYIKSRYPEYNWITL